METLYHQTNKLVQETQHLFTQLETSNADHKQIQETIESKINLINR
jgi:Golgi SNAP receptor complex protein 2